MAGTITALEYGCQRSLDLIHHGKRLPNTTGGCCKSIIASKRGRYRSGVVMAELKNSQFRIIKQRFHERFADGENP